jgi:hypothetical protein
VPPSPFDLELQRLEAALKQLENEYSQFFAGRLRRPPSETRARVETMVKAIDRRPILNTGDRFRFTSLQTRYSKLIDLWDRALRAREEGRVGPLAPPRADPPPAAPTSERPAARVMHVASFRDPAQEMDTLHKLYDSLVEARQAVGEDAVPFHKFAELVSTQVSKLKSAGNEEVAFRVAVKDGKVALTAKGVRGGK